MKIKDYWFALKSHVYVEFKLEQILLYDTKSGKRIETRQKDAITLVSQLYEPKNLGVTLLSKETRLNPNISGFVSEVIEKQMGDVMDAEKFSQKPVRLVPILNLQKDVNKLKKNKDNYPMIGNDAKNYLMAMNIYLNDSCSRNCPHCDKYNKQFICCTTQNVNLELKIEEIESIFRQIKYASVGNVNILGGNIFEYTGMAQLSNLLVAFKDIVRCYFHYENYKPNIVPDSLQLDVMITFPIKEAVFANIFDDIDKNKVTVHFIVENEDQYGQVENLVNKYGIASYHIRPVYTGENLKFFEDNVFVDREDLFFKTFSIREIFRNKKMNCNFFGLLNILPDGAVKANIHASELGNIKTDSLMRMIFKELIDNTAWRIIRDSQPCSDCIYQFICPPPSNYEKAIGKPDLCQIHSKNEAE